jgi:alkylated DNA repair dioxygenase AlkB
MRPILTKELPDFNHILVNVYPAGVGIMPHFDGALYRPKVVVLSLGGPAVISFTDSYKNTNKLARLLLEDQSVHIF